MGNKILSKFYSADQEVVSILGTNLFSHYINFTRASSATYFDSTGIIQTALSNIPRIDHFQDGSGLRGLRREGARTNQMKYSEDTGSDWNLSLVSRGTAISTLISGITAPLYVISSTSGLHYIDCAIASGSSITYVDTKDYVWSMYAKSGGYNDLRFEAPDGTIFATSAWGNGFNVNLDTGVITGDATGIKTRLLTDGWVYIEITRTAEANGSAKAFPIIYPEIFGVWAGDDVGGVYVVGVQAESLVDFASTYIPTSGATATRAADVCTIDNVDTLDWFNPLEGTIVCSFATEQDVDGFNRPYMLGDNSTNGNGVTIWGQFATVRGIAWDGSATQAAMSSTVSWDGGTLLKTAYAFKEDDFAISCNASTIVIDTSGTLSSSIDKFAIGSAGNGADPLFGIIISLDYYSSRIPNDTLEAITA